MTTTTNQLFSLARFGRLLRKQFIDNRGQWLTNILLLAGTMIALALVAYQDVPTIVENRRSALFLVVGWAAWYAFVWQQTDFLNQKERAIAYLLQPASALEKMLALWLITGVGFLVVYVSCFVLIDAVGVRYVNNRTWSAILLQYIKISGGSKHISLCFDSDDFLDIPPFGWLLTAVFHGFALAGMLSIRRYALAVVAVLGFVMVAGLFFLNMGLANQLIGPGVVVSGIPFEGVNIQANTHDSYHELALQKPVSDQLRWVVAVLTAVALYVAAYFKLNERTV
jgi:hypothetical protein